MPARRPPDVLHDLFCQFHHRPGFLSHLRSLKGYDEPEILPSSTRRICLIGADAGQSSTSTAYDPIAKWTIGRVSRHASASSAKSLLDKLIAEAPFAVTGIQVDGGAEFKSVFEAECQARGLELFVLPPKRPDLNGGVERAQSTWRDEFYATYDLPHRIDKLQAFVDAFAHKFNPHRPHDSLAGQTPAEYLQTLGQGDPPPSHM